MFLWIPEFPDSYQQSFPRRSFWIHPKLPEVDSEAKPDEGEDLCDDVVDMTIARIQMNTMTEV